MRTVLLSLLTLGLVTAAGVAAESRPLDPQQLRKLAGDAARTAESVEDVARDVPQSFAVRRSILILSERIARTGRQWPVFPANAKLSEATYCQLSRHRARQMLEDCENLMEAVRSLKNKAEAARDTRTSQQARELVVVAWSLKATTKKLEQSVCSANVTNTR